MYDVVIGDLESENHILIMGAMHAREYITTQVVMRQLCDYIEKTNDKNSTIIHNDYSSSLKKFYPKCFLTYMRSASTASLPSAHCFLNTEANAQARRRY